MIENSKLEEAKKTLLEECLKYHRTLTKIQPPDPEKALSYEMLLSRFTQMRAMPLWYPYIGTGRGNGALVELADGSVKYDFITGIGVHFGHGHPAIMKALVDAACQSSVMQGNLEQNIDSVKLAETLLTVSGMEHVFLTTSGAMALENALKLTFQKKAPAMRVLAFDRCFTGRTLALAQITDKPLFREGLPPTLACDYIPFYDENDPEGSEKRAVDALKKALWRYPRQYGAMVFELIQGEAGYYTAPPSFFKALMTVLKDNGVPIVIDEVQTFGRLPSLFAFQHYGLEMFADVVTIGKLFQMGATLFRSELKPKSGLLSQTFTGSTASIRAAQVIVDSLVHDGYLGEGGKIEKLSHHFRTHLKRMADSKLLSGPFGEGLMFAFTPFGGDKERVIPFVQTLFKKGVITFVAGLSPMRVRMLIPAGGISTSDLDIGASLIEETLKEMGT